jgi:hypothetical protein
MGIRSRSILTQGFWWLFISRSSIFVELHVRSCRSEELSESPQLPPIRITGLVTLSTHISPVSIALFLLPTGTDSLCSLARQALLH